MTAKRLNLLVIMTDDHAAWAAGCYGDPVVRTPNLDFLARTGARMSRAFTPNPVCSPARACFFTGRIPSQHGIHDWLAENPAAPKAWLSDEVTLPQLLQQQGYRTGLVGKWHCGNSFLPQPGFDYWLGYARGQYPHCGRQRFVENGRPLEFVGRQAPFLASKAAEFLRQPRGAQPFFLFVGLVDTHSPFIGHPERLVAPYRDAAPTGCLTEPAAPGPGWIRFGNPADDARRREWLAQYRAAVTLIDEQVGRLLDELEALGEADNTLVVYTSDHGHMNGQHGLYTKGNATVPQNFFDESIRVPLLARLPGQVRSGTELAVPVDHCDLFQTLLDFAGAAPAHDRVYPGQSFRALLAGQQAPWRDRQYCEYGNARAVRTERWKFIRRYPPHDVAYGDELYDLEADPRERNNVIGGTATAGIARELAADLERHFALLEVPGRSGREVLSLPAHNASEPWRLERPKETPPEGSEWRVLADY